MDVIPSPKETSWLTLRGAMYSVCEVPMVLAVWNIVKLCVGLSRGQLVRLVTLAFPGSLLRALRQVLGWREGSYADTLLGAAHP